MRYLLYFLSLVSLSGWAQTAPKPSEITMPYNVTSNTVQSWSVTTGQDFRLRVEGLSGITSLTVSYQLLSIDSNKPDIQKSDSFSAVTADGSVVLPTVFKLDKETDALRFETKVDGVEAKSLLTIVPEKPEKFTITATSNDTLPTSVHLDVRNYTFRKYWKNKKSLDFFLTRAVRTNKRIFVNPNIPIHIKLAQLPANHNLYVDGVLMSHADAADRLATLTLDPGANVILTVVSPGLAKGTNVRRRAANFLIGAVQAKGEYQNLTTIDFVGDTLLQNSISNPLRTTSLPASFGLGAVLNRINDRLWFNKYQIDAYFNFTSTLDTVRVPNAISPTGTYSGQIRDLGSALLLPNTARQSFFINARFHLRTQTPRAGFYGIERILQKTAQVVSGINFRAMAANRIITDYRSVTTVSGSTSTTATTETPFKIGVIGMRVGLFREFLKPELVRQNFSVIAGADLDFRAITGDLRNTDTVIVNGLRRPIDPAVKDFQVNVIKNEYVRFSGFNFYFLLRLKNIRAIIEYTNLSPYANTVLGFLPNRKKDKRELALSQREYKTWPGLTNGQISFTVAFTGGFPVKFD